MHPARRSQTTGAVMLFAVAALLAILLPAVLGAAESEPKNAEEGPPPAYGPRKFTFPHTCKVFVRRTEDEEWEFVGRVPPGGGTVEIPRCYAWLVDIDRLEPSWTWERLATELKQAEVPGLALYGPGITDAVLAHLKGLGQLRGLELWGCDNITDAGLAHLAGLTQLRELNLWGSREITDAGLAHLERLGKLQTLSLSADISHLPVSVRLSCRLFVVYEAPCVLSNLEDGLFLRRMVISASLWGAQSVGKRRLTALSADLRC